MTSVIDTGTAMGAGGSTSRRSFIKRGIAAGAVGVGYSLFGDGASVVAHAQGQQPTTTLTPGDAALLRFAAAAEILESDFWVQYNELGGIQDSEVSGGTGNPTYTAKLQVLDADF